MDSDASSWLKGSAAPLADGFELRARPVPAPADLLLDGVGPLKFQTGFELEGVDLEGDLRFGGFSGLVVEGDQVWAISDEATLWQSRLLFGEDGAVQGFSDNRRFVLRNDDGRHTTDDEKVDTEEILRHSGGWWVAAEGDHRILEYSSASETEPFGQEIPRRLPLPPEVGKLPENGGLEAATLLRDGSLFLIAEQSLREVAVTRPAWLGRPRDGKPKFTWSRLDLVVEGEFHPTSATTLPSGDVLLLERSWNRRDGVRLRLSILAESLLMSERPASAEPFKSREVALLKDAPNLDNMEGIHAHTDETGRTWVYLISDDNFSETQRTLFFQLLWDPPPEI